MSKFRIDHKVHFVVWVFFALSVGLYFLGKSISQESLQSFVQSYGAWAPIVYIVLHQASYVIAPISGYPFLIVGFYLFGNTTILYSFIVAVCGSSINFLIAKKWGRPIVKRLAGAESIREIDKLSKEYGLGMLFVLRLFLLGLGDFISYGYGLTPIKFPQYIFVSTFAMIPGYIFWYVVAQKTGNIEQFVGLSVGLTFSASGVFIVGRYIYRKVKKKK